MVKCVFCNIDVQSQSKHIKESHVELISEIQEKPKTIQTTLSAVRAVEEDIWGRQKRQLERSNEVLLLQLQQQHLIKALQGTPSQIQQVDNSTKTSIKEALELIKEIQNIQIQPQADDRDYMTEGAFDLIKAFAMQKINQTNSFPPPPAQKDDIIDVDIPPAPTEKTEDE